MEGSLHVASYNQMKMSFTGQSSKVLVLYEFSNLHLFKVLLLIALMEMQPIS